MTKASWTYMGCSTQRVPSLSKVAMRWSGGTKSGEPMWVTRCTKFVIVCLGEVLFQEGSGSDCACADGRKQAKKIAARMPMRRAFPQHKH